MELKRSQSLIIFSLMNSADGYCKLLLGVTMKVSPQGSLFLSTLTGGLALE